MSDQSESDYVLANQIRITGEGVPDGHYDMGSYDLTEFLSKKTTRKAHKLHFGKLMRSREREDVEDDPDLPYLHVKRRSERIFNAKESADSLIRPFKAQSTEIHKSLSVLTEQDSKLGCCNKLFFRWLQPKKAFFYDAQAIEDYMRQLDESWGQVIDYFEWPRLPGGEHKKARGYNYTSHALWILSYAAGIAYDPDQNKEDSYRDHYENLIVKAEQVGIMLTDFVRPVNDLERMFEPFEEMTQLTDVELLTPAYFGTNVKEIFAEALIPQKSRYRIRDYAKLRIYTRDVNDQEWVEFHELPFKDQMTRISDGINYIAQDLAVILKRLPVILKMLKNAKNGRESWKLPFLFPHIIRMKNSLKGVFKMAKISSGDERLIRRVFEQAQENTQFIIEQAVFGLINLWELVLMCRLAYQYVQECPNSRGTLRSMDEVLASKLPPKTELQQPDIKYTWKQFYDVNCAALLRKVPVFVGKTVELAIHLDGFINPNPSNPHNGDKDLGERRKSRAIVNP